MAYDIRQAILDASTQLGVSPLDLATAVSYETAGTFDPLKKGPTTQWGQHQGLIQWGKPQAQKYLGGDFSPESQAKGMVGYLRDTGVKPGMGLLDIYSLFGWVTINVPQWNWYRFPLDFTLANLATEAVGWLLAGFAIAWWLGRRTA